MAKFWISYAWMPSQKLPVQIIKFGEKSYSISVVPVFMLCKFIHD